MRALWTLVVLAVGCGASFETDGGSGGTATTSVTGATTRASGAVGSTTTTSTTSKASSAVTATTTTTGTGDPCIDGNYASCIATDGPLLHFSFGTIDGDGIVHSDVPGTDAPIMLQPASMAGSCAAGSLIGQAIDCMDGGYSMIGADVASYYGQLFEGNHAHTVELWIAQPYVEMGYSTTLFLLYGQTMPDTTVTGNSAFMGMDAGGTRSIGFQRRVYPGGVQSLLTAAVTLEADYAEPAHIVATYDGAGTVRLCRNAVCGTDTDANDGPLDRSGWYVGYIRNVQAYSGIMDELAFYPGVIDDLKRERHCRAGFTAMGLPTTPCTN